MKIQTVQPRYVPQLPERLEEGILYICEEFDLTAHKCCCGCDEDVYNKLSPVKWQLLKRRDGSVSLTPSIGNWNYACRSHYWIEENRVIDAGSMSESAIKAVRERDRWDRDQYIAQVNEERAGPRTRARTRLSGILSRVLRSLRALWPR